MCMDCESEIKIYYYYINAINKLYFGVPKLMFTNIIMTKCIFACTVFL